MTQYWLCILNRENWEVVQEQKIWGVSVRHENTIRKVEIGDRLLFYLIGEMIKEKRLPSSLAGKAEVKCPVFKDNSRIFNSPEGKRETYPLRINLTNLQVSSKEISFKPFIPELKFITNKKRWSGHLQGRAMRTIPESDYALLTRNL
jgi:predicted RNA-binding protein